MGDIFPDRASTASNMSKTDMLSEALSQSISSHLQMAERIGQLERENAELRKLRDPQPNEQLPSLPSLPPELWTRVFSFLADRRDDIGACRLVSRAFRDMSSPFLMTSVVLSKDAYTIFNLYDVMEHPYFRKHVTHLIYDATFFEKQTATSFERHEFEMGRRHERLRYGTSPDDAFYQALWKRIHRLPLRGGLTPYLRPAGDYHRRLVREHPLWAGERSSYLGYLEYARFWLDQESVVHDQIHRVALEDSLDLFPKLRHVKFGDFRSRARHTDKCHEDLVRRLYGQAAEPLVLSNSDGFGWEDFWQVLESLGTRPTSIRSISIGDSPWGYPLGIEDLCCHMDALSHPALPLDDFPRRRWKKIETTPYEQLFSNLRELKLPLRHLHGSEHHYEGLKESIIPSILSWSSNLVQLTLVSANSISEDSGNFIPYYGGELHLAETLFPLHYSSLRCLDLRGWELEEADELATWLEKHASTLKQLRLVDNLIDGSMLDFAGRIGQSMSLSGVAFAVPSERLSFKLLEERGALTSEDVARENLSRDMENTMLCGRKNALFIEGNENWRRLEMFADC